MNQSNSSASKSAQDLPSVNTWQTIYAGKQVGDCFDFGRYPQGADGEIEPITWRILQRNADRLLVIAEKGLDCKPYNADRISINWAGCTLRRWLNSEFYDKAFNEQERKYILQTSIVNDAGPKTEDYIFLLSVGEARSLIANESELCAKPTEYAVKNGAHSYDDCCCWWLRSRGIGGDSAACVAPDGLAGDLGLGVNSDNVAVRPALSVHISPTTPNSVAKLSASRNYVLLIAVLALVAVTFYLSTVLLKEPGSVSTSPEPMETPAVTRSVASSPEPMQTPAVAQSVASSPEPMETPAAAQSATSSPEPMGTSAVAQSAASLPKTMVTPDVTQTAAISASSLHNIYAYKQVGECFEFGRYPQGANGDSKSITWRVLQRYVDHLLVIAERGLDCKPYNTGFISIDWAGCTLRDWLNSEFYDKAFYEQERACILKTSIVNDAGPKTEDYIFLLSVDEAKSLFANDMERCAKATEYADGNGTFVYLGRCWWWLRSRGNHVDDAAYVRADGHVYVNGGRVQHDNIAVRPALKLAL